MIRILLDQSVDSNLQLAEGAAIPHRVHWGGKAFDISVAGIRLKSSIAKRDPAFRAQVSALPTIARLARNGAITLCTYSELRHEAMQSSVNLFISNQGDLRTGYRVVDVDAAVERSYFQQMDMSEYVQDAALHDFYKWLLQLDYERLKAGAPSFVGRLPEFMRRNLDALSRFRELCKAVGKAHVRDAFHLWTAEVNGLEYFLTMDGKFVRALTLSSKVRIKTHAVQPTSLLDALGVAERDPMPLEEGYVYDAAGHAYRV